jgi:hypothetical protein
MIEPRTVSEFAERVLMGTSLEEKLTHAPKSLVLEEEASNRPPSRGVPTT